MIDQSVIMSSGDRWSIMKIDDQSFSIMEQADTALSVIVNIYKFADKTRKLSN